MENHKIIRKIRQNWLKVQIWWYFQTAGENRTQQKEGIMLNKMILVAALLTAAVLAHCAQANEPKNCFDEYLEGGSRAYHACWAGKQPERYRSPYPTTQGSDE